MRRECSDCHRVYDDEHRSTICPHDGLHGLCIEHDLYNCPHHKPGSRSVERESGEQDHVVGHGAAELYDAVEKAEHET